MRIKRLACKVLKKNLYMINATEASSHYVPFPSLTFYLNLRLSEGGVLDTPFTVMA